MTVDLTNIFRRNPEIVHSDMDGETVMMSIESGAYFGLNSVGSEIWDLLQQDMSGEQICAALLKKFDVSEAQCVSEISQFLENMVEQKVIEIV